MDSASEIGLEGAVTIAHAAELKSLLVEELSAAREVRICLTRATVLDVCALQLLFCAAREWQRMEMNFAFLGPLPGALSEGIANAGFEAFPVAVEPAVLSEV
jgi:anti-anti-sigma regulatory factor